jgi:phospholipase C
MSAGRSKALEIEVVFPMRIPNSYICILCCLVLSAAFSLSGCRGINTTSSAGGPGGGSGGNAHLPPANSAVQRIIVVILQNNTYDHLFGTFPGANGFQPGALGYTQTDANGKSVTPFLLGTTAPPALPEGRANYLRVWDNGLMDKFAFYNGDIAMGYYDSSTPGVDILWSYAQQFALADNYFASVMSEAPTNQLYMVAAQDALAYPVQPFYPPCQKSDPAAKPYTYTNVGDQLTANKIDWKVFVENYGTCSAFNPEHDPFQYFTSTQNTSHIQDFSQFASQLANDTLPAVTFIIPGNGHDLHPGGASVLNAVTWIDHLVKEIQNSSAWPDAAIVLTFDDGGGWYDHVPPPQVDTQGLSFRVPTLVISPLAKKGYISHVQMDHVSILKFIQWNWGLPSLNSRNDMSNDIRDMFEGF